jgi:hypothetical protein
VLLWDVRGTERSNFISRFYKVLMVVCNTELFGVWTFLFCSLVFRISDDGQSPKFSANSLYFEKKY